MRKKSKNFCILLENSTLSRFLPGRESEPSYGGQPQHYHRYSANSVSYPYAMEDYPLIFLGVCAYISKGEVPEADNLFGTDRKVQLTLLFGVGIFVVAVTITRVPLIFDQSASQNARTLVSPTSH